MLRQASLSDLITGRVSRDSGYVVITMRRYPRFIHKELRDEFHVNMSPDAKLLEDFLAAKRKSGDHDAAFPRSSFEERFDIDEQGRENLKRLSAMAKRREVYLVCNCPMGRRCHREMNLLAAAALFGAPIERPANKYAVFEKRLKRGEFAAGEGAAPPSARGRAGKAPARKARPRARAQTKRMAAPAKRKRAAAR